MTSPSRTRRRFDPAPLYKALFLTVMAAFVAVPLIATVLGGFKSLGELRTNPFGLPQRLGVGELLPASCSRSATGMLLRNSLIIASLSTCPDPDRRLRWRRFVFAHMKFFGSRDAR